MKLKKRTIFAIIATITFLIVLITSKPMPVSFDVKGNGDCRVEVLLNKKDNSEFKKVKKEASDINFNGQKHVELYVKHSRCPKRFRIILSDYQKNQYISISNIQLADGKLKLNKLDKFEVEGADAKINNGSITFKPKNNYVTITYTEPLHIFTAFDFDIRIIIIILVLGFLLTYKLADYIADFKTIEGKSRADIIFLTVFFIFLFIPMSHINNEEISTQENRTLAKFKPLITKGETHINYNFGNDFNTWFNDRFFLRNIFISFNDTKLILSRNWITRNVIKGKDGWLFLGWKEAKDTYTNSTMFTEEELKQIDDYLQEIDEYCKNNDKKFYFFIAPDKSKIYGEYYSDVIKPVQEKSRAEQLIEYINQNSKVKVIYPKKELLSHKDSNLLYWKSDTHWNLLGGYYGYQELIKEIKKDYNGITLYKVTEYTTESLDGDLYKMAPTLLRKPDKTTYKVPKINVDSICEYLGESGADGVTCINNNNKLNLVMYRDSFSLYLIPYLAKTFKNSEFIWKDNVTQKSLTKADIVIFEVVERRLPELVKKHMEVEI